MRLVIVRHGETEYNKTKMIQGQQQIPLNDNGRVQAEQIARSLMQSGLTHIYCSNLIRARETADIINATFGLQVIADSRLNERNFGVWETKSYDEIIKQYPDLEQHFGWRIWDHTPDHSEPLDSLINRAVEFVWDVSRRHRRSDVVLIVTHGGPMRVITGFIKGLDSKEYMRTSIPNGQIFETEFENSKFTFE